MPITLNGIYYTVYEVAIELGITQSVTSRKLKKMSIEPIRIGSAYFLTAKQRDMVLTRNKESKEEIVIARLERAAARELELENARATRATRRAEKLAAKEARSAKPHVAA